MRTLRAIGFLTGALVLGPSAAENDDLTVARSAFASGDLEEAARLLEGTDGPRSAGEAYLLTRVHLARQRLDDARTASRRNAYVVLVDPP